MSRLTNPFFPIRDRFAQNPQNNREDKLNVSLAVGSVFQPVSAVGRSLNVLHQVHGDILVGQQAGEVVHLVQAEWAVQVQPLAPGAGEVEGLVTEPVLDNCGQARPVLVHQMGTLFMGSARWGTGLLFEEAHIRPEIVSESNWK